MKKKALTLSQARKILSSLGSNAALPFAIFDEDLDLVSLNKRMTQILKAQTLKLPVLHSEMEFFWPFHNEWASQEAHWLEFRKKLKKEKASTEVAQSGLKTFKLSLQRWQAKKKAYFVLTAEVLRTGDLLDDRAARMELFRSLSHEIRSSVMALEGYMNMLKDKAASSDASILERMNFCTKRLSSVVSRLEDFKAEMNLFSSPENDAGESKVV